MSRRVHLHPSLVRRHDPVWPVAREEYARRGSRACKGNEGAKGLLLLGEDALLRLVGALHLEGLGGDLDELDLEAAGAWLERGLDTGGLVGREGFVDGEVTAAEEDLRKGQIGKEDMTKYARGGVPSGRTVPGW